MESTFGHHNTGNTDDLFVDVVFSLLILMLMAWVAWPFPGLDLETWNLGALALM